MLSNIIRRGVQFRECCRQNFESSPRIFSTARRGATINLASARKVWRLLPNFVATRLSEDRKYYGNIPDRFNWTMLLHELTSGKRGKLEEKEKSDQTPRGCLRTADIVSPITKCSILFGRPCIRLVRYTRAELSHWNTSTRIYIRKSLMLYIDQFVAIFI